MSAELDEVISALKANDAFGLLTDEDLIEIATNIQIRYARKDECVQQHGIKNNILSYVRKGAVDVRNPDNSLFMRVAEGDCFGFFSLLTGGEAAHNTYAIEDSLIYRIPADLFHKARKNYVEFDRYFSQEHESRLKDALTRQPINRGTVELMTHTLEGLINKEPIMVAATMTIKDAAKIMNEHHISSLLIECDDGKYGIITDRDLRNNVIAVGKSPEDPIIDIATIGLVSGDANTIAFEALHTLMRHNMHHLPVMRDNKPIGMITMTDIMRLQSANSVFLLNSIYKAQSADDVAKASSRLPNFIKTLVDADATAQHIGHAVTSISEAITNRLIDLAIEQLGEPPARFCWLSFGSQARNEQTAHSDQDNGLVIEDGALPKYDEYFKSLAKFVSDGLNQSGFIYCPGNVMATNDQWRQDQSTWRTYFSDWVQKPDPQSLLNASIFFDIRPLYGDFDLAHELIHHILEIVPKNTIFQSMITANALGNSAPLGFFRNFVLEGSGEHKDHLDIKHNGIALVVDIARCYALSLGVNATNSDKRIKLSAEQSGVSESRAEDLRDAFEFIGQVRLKHQAAQIKAGEKPDNYINPKSLSSFERHHLKDAFKIINEVQRGMGSRFNAIR